MNLLSGTDKEWGLKKKKVRKVYNIFITNFKWQINDGLKNNFDNEFKLKLIKNLLFKICCEIVVNVTFL